MCDLLVCSRHPSICRLRLINTNHQRDQWLVALDIVVPVGLSSDISTRLSLADRSLGEDVQMHPPSLGKISGSLF